jgi:hypothetical protein
MGCIQNYLDIKQGQVTDKVAQTFLSVSVLNPSSPEFCTIISDALESMPTFDSARTPRVKFVRNSRSSAQRRGG